MKTAQNAHVRTARNYRRGGKRHVEVTLAGRQHPELESEEVVHDRRACNDNVPLDARLVPIEAPDPYSLPGESEEITVMCCLRNDPLRWLHFRGRIDDVQFHAGRRWQRDWEESAIGKLQTNFPRRQRINGGKAPEVLDGAALAASRRLRHANDMLGRNHVRLIEDVFAGRVVAIGAAERTLRGILDLLAIHYDLAGGNRAA